MVAYREVRDADARGRHGVFIAEGRFVVRTLLADSPLATRSVFVTPVALESIRDVLPDDTQVYLAEQDVMNDVVGFNIHRGCLAAGDRPAVVRTEGLLQAAGGRAVVVLEDVNNHDNIGGLFRSAIALGAGGVLLGPRCADPLYRKSIRVSMGAALRLPFGTAALWPDALETVRAAGYTLLALTPDADADDIGSLAVSSPVALLLGAEGPGLSQEAMGRADRRVRIGMVSGVDSLNVVVAAAIALHRVAVP
ncbi:MAG: RNA methyltransferase [Planctomycetota bacterium]